MKWYYILAIILGVLIAISVIVLLIFLIIDSTDSSSSSSSSGVTYQNNILKITNEFDFPIWVEGKYGSLGTPVPIGQELYVDNDLLNKYAPNSSDQNYWKSAVTTIEIPPNNSVFYNIDPGGLAGARFWAKFSCAPCGAGGTYATSPAVCLPPYPVGCSTNNTCQYTGSGTNCVIGDSSQYYIPPTSTNSGGSVGGCALNGCSIPIDSLFEGTFACSLEDTSKCNPNPSSGEPLSQTTFFDTSQVDGYTFPYIVLITGATDGGIMGQNGLNTCINTNSGMRMPLVNIDGTISAYLDSSGLISGKPGLLMDYSDTEDGPIGCPDNTNLSASSVTSVTDSSIPVTYDLNNVDLGLYMDASTGQLNYPYISSDGTGGFIPGTSPPNNSVKIGCMSSCRRLTYTGPYGMNQSEACNPGISYCCPTTYETGCTGSGCCNGTSPACSTDTTNNKTTKTGCVTSDQCNQGPVVTSDYVQSVHNMAPGIYAYTYDDSQGLYSCGDGVTYEIIFGPNGSNPTNYWNNLWSGLNPNN